METTINLKEKSEKWWQEFHVWLYFEEYLYHNDDLMMEIN